MITEKITALITMASDINAKHDRYKEFSKRKQVDDITKLIDHAIKDLKQATNLVNGWERNGNVR